MNKKDYERLGYIFDGFGRWATEEDIAKFTDDEIDTSCVVFLNDREVIEPYDFDFDNNTNDGWVETAEYIVKENGALEGKMAIQDEEEVNTRLERVLKRTNGKVRVLSVRAANRMSEGKENKFWDRAQKIIDELG